MGRSQLTVAPLSSAIGDQDWKWACSDTGGNITSLTFGIDGGVGQIDVGSSFSLYRIKD